MLPWPEALNVLCVRLDPMGDVLMTTPALRALKESLPSRHITLLTSPSGAAIAPYIPEIDHVITYNAPWVKHGRARNTDADRRMINRLSAARFDAAVIFTAYNQSALPAAMLCMMADIPLCLAHSRENPYLLLSDWVRDPEPQDVVRHEVQRQLDLVRTIGAQTDERHLSFTVYDADRDSLHQVLESRGIDTRRPWLTLHPGASAASRRYAPEQYAVAVREICARLNCPVLITGSGEETLLCHTLQKSIGQHALSLAGELSIGELGALICDSTVLLANNSAVVHIAAAVGTPVVDLYALTSPQQTPWVVPNRVLFHDVPCRNCDRSTCPQGHHNCLAKIEPHEVVSAVCELWHEHAPRSGQFARPSSSTDENSANSPWEVLSNEGSEQESLDQFYRVASH